jgi:hypothetical protein
VAGYSGTPLAKKLGIKEQTKVVAVDAPKGYRTLLEPLPAAVQFASKVDKTTDIVHVFSTKRAELARALAGYRKMLDSSAAVWVSWPKKSAKVPTDITEDVVREVALPLGFVDIKVCAVDEVWSGLKLVAAKSFADSMGRSVRTRTYNRRQPQLRGERNEEMDRHRSEGRVEPDPRDADLGAHRSLPAADAGSL